MSDRYEIPQSQLAGYLHKKATNGDWQRRYFEINGSYLTYYKTSKMAKLLAALAIPQVGSIKLLGQTDLGAEFQIDIKDRQYVLRAATLSEAQTWVDTLAKVRDSGSNPSNPINNSQNVFANHTRNSSTTTASSASTSFIEPTAKVQKSVRNSCLCCFRRS